MVQKLLGAGSQSNYNRGTDGNVLVDSSPPPFSEIKVTYIWVMGIFL